MLNPRLSNEFCSEKNHPQKRQNMCGVCIGNPLTNYQHCLHILCWARGYEVTRYTIWIWIALHLISMPRSIHNTSDINDFPLEGLDSRGLTKPEHSEGVLVPPRWRFYYLALSSIAFSLVGCNGIFIWRRSMLVGISCVSRSLHRHIRQLVEKFTRSCGHLCNWKFEDGHEGFIMFWCCTWRIYMYIYVSIYIYRFILYLGCVCMFIIFIYFCIYLHAVHTHHCVCWFLP